MVVRGLLGSLLVLIWLALASYAGVAHVLRWWAEDSQAVQEQDHRY